jgi:hypothetical protein
VGTAISVGVFFSVLPPRGRRLIPSG